MNEMEKRWSELEHKHQLRCFWSEVIGNRTIIVECMWVPAAQITIMVTKHYDRPLAKNGYNKPWPNMIGHYVYFPAGGVTWEDLNKALTDIAKSESEAA